MFGKMPQIPLLSALGKFDEIFGVLEDNDEAKMRSILEWAGTEGLEEKIEPDLLEIAGEKLHDEQVNQKLDEMEKARKARDFKLSDALRSEVPAAGIILESTKDGPRWRRKAGYKTSIAPLCPVAIKLNQSEVHAPDHLTWGIVTCDVCKEKFAIGPNRIFGSQGTPEDYVKELDKLLKADHVHARPHANSYELNG